MTMTVTHEEQATERAVVLALENWLRARGWIEVGRRWRPHSAPAHVSALMLSAAVTLPRGAPRRSRRAR